MEGGAVLQHVKSNGEIWPGIRRHAVLTIGRFQGARF